MEPLRVPAWVAALCVATAAATASVPTTPKDSASEGPLSARGPRLLLNKCCGPDQMLDEFQRDCVTNGNATRDAVGDEETVAALASRPCPWWLDSRMCEEKRPGEQILRVAAPDSVVRYGRRPCGSELAAALWRTKAEMFPNGTIQFNLTLQRSGLPNSVSPMSLPPELFCVDKSYKDKQLHFVYLTCPCERVPCVRKCCNSKSVMEVSPSVAMSRDVACIAPSPNKTRNITLVRAAGGGGTEPADVRYALLPGPFRWTCAHGRHKIHLLNRSPEEAIHVLANGSLFWKSSGSPLLPREYCVDYGVLEGVERFRAMACAEDAVAGPLRPLSAVYVALYCVGVLFLLATLGVYALLPALRRPANAKALMCHVAAWAAALGMLCASRAIPMVSEYSTCAAMAFTAQFFLLASFFWLTVLCFDISRGFSAALRPLDQSARVARRRVLLYSLFAWGGPALIVAVSVALNYAKALPRWVLRPGIGERGCWFSGFVPILAYYYGPVAVLLVANSVMFCFTVVRLRGAQRETSVLKGEGGRLSGGALRRRRERLLLYAKLYALMGATWLLEVVAWVAGADEATLFVVDSVNVLRGAGVFAACCVKRGVLSALDERVRALCPCPCGAARGRDRGLSYTATTSLSAGASDASHRPRAAGGDER